MSHFEDPQDARELQGKVPPPALQEFLLVTLIWCAGRGRKPLRSAEFCKKNPQEKAQCPAPIRVRRAANPLRRAAVASAAASILRPARIKFGARVRHFRRYIFINHAFALKAFAALSHANAEPKKCDSVIVEGFLHAASTSEATSSPVSTLCSASRRPLALLARISVMR